jgi:hypothetical protein
MIESRIEEKNQRRKTGTEMAGFLTSLLGVLRPPAKESPPPLPPLPDDKEQKPIREIRLESEKRRARALLRPDPIR